MAEKKNAEKKEFRTFYPSLPGKDTVITVLGKQMTVKTTGYKTGSEEEEKAFADLASDPRWHITTEDPNPDARANKIAYHRAEIERLEKEV